MSINPTPAETTPLNTLSAQMSLPADKPWPVRWKRRGILALALLVVLVVGGVLISRAIPSKPAGPTLTHTVTRGDLIVSVTEQGTLESSNNYEVKCRVRGTSTVTWVIPAGTIVKPGDELVRLDTKVLEEEFSLTKTNVHIATATLERSKADVEGAKIAFKAYKEGRFRAQLQALEKELEAAQRNLESAQTMLGRSETLFRQGYVTDLEVDGNGFTVKRAELELKVKETEIKVLTEYTQKMELETLDGNLIAGLSKRAADEAGLAMEVKRRDRAEAELAACVIRADRAGLVIYPSAAAWRRTPDITAGATVRKDQILLLMPDLAKMQVKVGIHEAVIDRVKPGLGAVVTLPGRSVQATVSSVASVTRPAGWWTGNVVKYDTIVDLPKDSGLKPGMNAAAQVILAVHKNVLTVPVASVVQSDEGSFCWVKTATGPERRVVKLGDSNDVFIVVEGGVREGEEVVLNPTAFIKNAQTEAAKLGGPEKSSKAEY